jgi:hypothetical protein
MAKRARECGLALQAEAFPASPEKTAQAPLNRMSYVDPDPLGTMRHPARLYACFRD